MKKSAVFAVLTGVLAGTSFDARAAYPVYQAAYPTTYQATTAQGQVIALPNQTSVITSTSLPANTRVTGSLPRVG
ncbi:MAG TPA: hypothetical protein DD611_00520, partial [Alphaproteobacteria bacterium]|nr:hypothetical protein [Alphaproteobacteria bacterium]